MVVIRIGRSRIGPALSSASFDRQPSRGRSWLVRSTSRIAFLVTRPISITTPIIAGMPRLLPVQQQRQQRADDRERQRQHDQERLEERLELRRQHDVDEGDRQDHRQAHRRRRLLHQLDVAGEAPLEVRRHRHAVPSPPSTSAVTSPSGRSSSSMPILACRRRCSRSMLVGPTPGSMRTMSPVRTARRAASRAACGAIACEVVAELRRQPHADVVFLVAVAQLGRHHAFDHAAQLRGDAWRRRSRGRRRASG